MSKDDSLRDLIERVERAEGPERRLNADLLLALGWFGDKKGALDPKGNRVSTIPDYLGSVDAAMTLLGPEAFWRLGHDGEGPDPALFKAEVLSPMLHRLPYVSICATPALALCAASLKARMGTGG